jgi:cytochrome c nitrite reductase small subunit
MNPFEKSVMAAHATGLSLAGWIVLVLSVLCILLIIRIIVQDPKKTARPFGKWLLLLIFFVLSPIIYLLNFGSSLEESKTVDFCNSCHPMRGFVHDLRNPDSQYLASEHYQYRWIANDQCFTCHSNYGLFGDAEAKMDGIRHVWAYYITGYKTPIKLYGTYNNGICLRCHAPTLGFQQTDEHVENASDIISSKMSCLGLDCHVKPHPKEAWKLK